MKPQTIDEVLEHYGVKGMHWGVRKKASAAPSGSPESVVVKTQGSRVIVKGGGGHPASEDSINAAVGLQKARKSGTGALSNQEMKLVVERMNLEQQFAKLNPTQKKLGAEFIRFAVQNPEVIQKSYGLWQPQSRESRMKSAMELGAAVAKASAKKKK